MKEFKIDVKFSGTVREEDPYCPSEWRGSGCYDIDVPSSCCVSFLIVARDEKRAREIVSDYDFDEDLLPNHYKIDSVKIRSASDCDDDEEYVEAYYEDIYG